MLSCKTLCYLNCGSVQLFWNNRSGISNLIHRNGMILHLRKSYVDDCVYWYTNEALGKWFVDTTVKIFHVNFLGDAHWFMSVLISQMKDHSISVDQDRYATSIVAKYVYTSTAKLSKRFYKTTFPDDMIFTKEDASTSDEQV